MPRVQSPKSGARTATLWIPVAAYMAFIFALSSISHPPALPGQSDKAAHALLYGGLGALFARALVGGWRGVTWRIVLLTIVFGAIYGASDELHQYFNPPRSVEALDVLADTIGSGVGAIALYWWGIIQGRNGV
jgi:VanZ family protein